MPTLARLLQVVLLGCLALVPFACGKGAEVTPGNGTGGSGNAPNVDVCQELFGDQCGRPCDTDHPCPDGMNCRAGKCDAECGTGFPCEGGRTCSASGICAGLTPPPDEECTPQTCAEVGFECGIMVDRCGNVVDCAEEGRSCSANEVCVGNPTECVPGNFFEDCDVCSSIPDCSGQAQVTVLRGRVVSPGRDDGDTANQVGIPNAVVYILRSADAADLPPIPQGVPAGGERCDRCDEQDYGPVLAGAVTDATGAFELSEYIPVGTEFVLVVKAGKFRRATTFTLPADGACQTTELPTALPDNPTRLPRHTTDGLAVNLPRIAVSTGRIDAMECVFHKMGLAAEMFGSPTTDRPVHLYQGANASDRPAGGAWPLDDQAASCAECEACPEGTGTTAQNCRAAHCGGTAQTAKATFLRDNCPARGCRACNSADNTTRRLERCGGTGTSANRTSYLDSNCRPYLDTRFLETQSEIDKYDMLVMDCQGTSYDHAGGSPGARRSAHGARLREYVNRGGRMFASHLSHTWLYENGDAAYAEDDPWQTGLSSVATWEYQFGTIPTSGTGQVALPEYWTEQSEWAEDTASPRIESFAAWMVNEGITTEESNHTFDLVEPRSMCISPGDHTEVFVDGVTGSPGAVANRVQQFSFNTPYAAPEAAACGRVAYSGFHVAAESGGGSSPFEDVLFPAHCDGNLSSQEKVLLYMLFDLGACVGSDPPAPPCVPVSCPAGACGFMPNGCGGVLDCGTCMPKPVR
jgi:hypothetical protein